MNTNHRWIKTLWLVTLTAQALAATPPAESEAKTLPYAIVVTGGELLAGAYPDGHTHFLTRTLGPLGLRCVGSLCVDDKRMDLHEALRYASERARLVIVTGGLGPTDNDITRETLADFTGIAIEEHPDALRQLAKRFGTSPDRLRSNLRNQTKVPVQGTFLQNQHGTAVGLVFEMSKSTIVALPGPPRELQAMVLSELLPYLAKRFGTGQPGCSLTLRFVGLGQSQIDQTLGDQIGLDSDISLSSQFRAGRVDFTFSLPQDRPQDRAKLQVLKQEILKHLGRYVYAAGTATLEDRIIELLKAKGSTLALAEVGSGGSLSAALSGAADANQVLVASFAAPSEERLRVLLGVADAQWQTAASPRQKTEALALALTHKAPCHWAVTLGEPQKGRGDAQTLFMAVKHAKGECESVQIPIRGTRQEDRARLVTNLLDHLRRILQEE